jgi:hypothetical protein
MGGPAVKISISNYRSRRSGADDPQARCVEIGPLTVWFSYTTPVAFQVDGERRVVRRNNWGPTTGSHLNAIDRSSHGDRVSGEEFSRLLHEKIARYFFPRDLDADCPAYVVADWLEDRGLHRAAEAVRKEEVK